MVTEDYEEEFEAAECPTCGALVPFDAVECSECGQKFETEEDPWEEEEVEEEEWIEEEEEDEWGEVQEEGPGKFKFYLGIFLVVLGSIGMSLMTWLHNELELFEGVISNYAPDVYGPYDQMTGGSGVVVTIIGIVLIFLWMKEVKSYKERVEEPTKGDTDYFEDEYEEEDVEEEEEEVVEEEEPVDEIPCPECSELNPANATECWICGFALTTDEEEEVEEEDVEEEEVEEDDQIRCPNCGTKNEADAEYCANCEHDLSGGTEIWGEE